jgi:hypothetical protein
MDPTGATARRFPLIARARPRCLPLPARLRAVEDLAQAAEREAYRGLASSAFNQAALLASDVGLPGLARQWCHQHANAYLQASPLSGMDAIRGLEPLVNLARLYIRAGHADQGHQLILALYHAISEGSTARIDGITVPAQLTATRSDHDEVRQWLWRVTIADGTRALTSAGRWQDAFAHLQRHRGVGNRMLDGRQVAVVTRMTTGDCAGARSLIVSTQPGELWENAVTACLAALCRSPGQHASEQDIGAMVDRCRQVDAQATLIAFRTRLLLSVLDAAYPLTHPGVAALTVSVASQILDLEDGYAARELLSHSLCVSRLNDNQIQRLADTVAACALGHQAMAPEIEASLRAPLNNCGAIIAQALADPEILREPERRAGRRVR